MSQRCKNDLSKQQDTIKNQTEKLAENDKEIAEQQLILEKQNIELTKLINDYFELKGLTQQGAKRLIEIAIEVQETKDSLITAFEDRMLEIDSLKKSIFSEHSNVIEQLSKLIGSFQVDFQNQTKALSGIVDDSLIAAAVSTNEKLDSYSQRWHAEKETVLSSIGGLQDKLSTEMQSQNVKLSALVTDIVRLQELQEEHSRQSLVQADKLSRLVNEVDTRTAATVINLNKKLKAVVWSFSGALVVTLALFGYLKFTSFT